MKQTPLYEEHQKLNAKMTEFGGFLMPIEYSGLSNEHHCVRNTAGFFDISHMGEFEVEGRDAERFLNHLLSNDITELQEGSTQYHFLLNEEGNVIDDLIAYKKSKERFLLVVNASNMQKDWDWINQKKDGFEIRLKNSSDEIGMIAVQGPVAVDFLARFSKFDLKSIKKFDFAENVDVFDQNVLISRTGYTGEDGFEIYASPASIIFIWQNLLKEGEERSILPCGLGCRDTLRFQAGLPLYGNELSEDINPFEANLGMFVKLEKGEFIGREALLKKNEEGLKRKIVAFQMNEKVIPRHGYEVYANGEAIGFVTTGYMLPDNRKSVGFAMVDLANSAMGSEFEIKIRKNLKTANVIAKKEFKEKI